MKLMIAAVKNGNDKGTIYDEACEVSECMNTLHQLIMLTNISFENGVGIENINAVLELIEVSAEEMANRMKDFTNKIGRCGLGNSCFINIKECKITPYSPLSMQVDEKFPAEDISPRNEEI